MRHNPIAQPVCGHSCVGKDCKRARIPSGVDAVRQPLISLLQLLTARKRAAAAWACCDRQVGPLSYCVPDSYAVIKARTTEHSGEHETPRGAPSEQPQHVKLQSPSATPSGCPSCLRACPYTISRQSTKCEVKPVAAPSPGCRACSQRSCTSTDYSSPLFAETHGKPIQSRDSYLVLMLVEGQSTRGQPAPPARQHTIRQHLAEVEGLARSSILVSSS